MQSAVSAFPTSGRNNQRGFVDRLLNPIARQLRTGDPAATADRLFSSQHVRDLRLIIAAALVAVMAVLVIGFPLSGENQVVNNWKEIEARKSDWIFVRLLFATLSTFFTFFAPVLAAFAAILAWAYQVGSARLGVVDLFACEISTLCRVVTIVDRVSRCVANFNQVPATEPAGSHVPARQFTSQESYFPVFENNTRDLQTLEARVVVNITAFYTYMKAFRDAQRALVEIISVPEAERWHEAARNVVYTLFLGLESARHAIADLVEFEPEQAERTIVILISELEAYRFLRGQFTDEEDIHYQRIALREPEYRRVVPKLFCLVEANGASERNIGVRTESPEPEPTSQWEPARRLLRELRRRYEAAIEPINR
jgi:hypothetical protein